MANRVLLNSDGLKVSKAGVNVLSAADIDLLFTSDAAQPSVWMRGSVGRMGEHQTRTINFGKTFSRQPWVTINIQFEREVHTDGWINYGYRRDYDILQGWLISDQSSFEVHSGHDDIMWFNYIVWDFDL